MIKFLNCTITIIGMTELALLMILILGSIDIKSYNNGISITIDKYAILNGMFNSVTNILHVIFIALLIIHFLINLLK